MSAQRFIVAGACLTLLASVEAANGACGSHTVAILVDPKLVASIRAGLSQFETDLCTDGYNTVEHSAGFADPLALRAHLKQLYDQPGRSLAGAILIGAFPHAYQWVTAASSNPSIPSTSEEALSFQYYADLNGTFARSPGYVSQGGRPYSYDLHSGDVNWEIWVAVLPYYKGHLAQTADALNRYFARNHAYRTGWLRLPQVFLQISEHYRATTRAEHQLYLDAMRSGPYAWTPFSNAPDARLYFDSPPGGLSVPQGYADLQAGVADFTVTDTHGYWGAGGQLTIAAVETNPVRTIFFWSNGCAIGDLDRPDNFLTSVLYSRVSEVLIAKGTTNNSGGMGNNSNGSFGHNMAAALASGASFGQAILSHVNVPLIVPWSSSREFHFGTAVILGDPTLPRKTQRVPAAPKIDKVVHGVDFQEGIVPGSWMTIFGSSLAGIPRAWTERDFQGDRLPTTLDGVRVNVNGKPAYVYYVSPGQANVLAPDDSATGAVKVELVNAAGRAEGTATLARFHPAFFSYEPEGGRYVIAFSADWAYLARPGLLPNVTTRAARPRETVILYGSGFGPADPALPAGLMVAAARPLANPVTVSIGGLMAPPVWSGQVGSGLYQIMVTVPELPAGDHSVVAEIGGARSAAARMLTIQP